MKFSVIIIIIVGLLSSSFGKFLIYTNYLLNIEQITLKYCENKSKPALKCNGKCHLKKQIKEQEKKEDQSKSNVKADNEIQLFSNDFDLVVRRQSNLNFSKESVSSLI